MIKLNNIKNKKVGILGLGISGIGAARLSSYLGAFTFISDSSKIKHEYEIPNIEYEFDGHTKKILDSDFIIKSPGINQRCDIIKKINNLNIPLISEIEFASWFSSSPIIAVTGSNGKSTAVSLLNKIFQNNNYDTLLGGNIGISFSENVLKEIKRNKHYIHILEISSFQMQNTYSFSPNISCILNLSEDHLDIHESFEEYANCKLKIASNSGTLVYNSDDCRLSSIIKEKEMLNTLPYSKNYQENSTHHINGNFIINNASNIKEIDLRTINLLGIHNSENILAVLAILKSFDLKQTVITKTLKEFKPISHRMELVFKKNGILYINDSKATNLTASIAAIKSFKNKIILILGGLDKSNTDFSILKKYLKNKIDTILCYGKSGPSIMSQINSMHFYRNFKDCIEKACNLARPGSIVLLSPGCASYDQFKNYKERGLAFEKIIKVLNK